MKRSRSIKLVLVGGLSAGALGGCTPSANRPPAISSANYYTNNYYVPGVGYYHAPFQAWYPLRYNQYDAQKHRYYFGGQWANAPHQSIINISSPTSDAVQMAQAARTDISRGGFGSISHGHWIGA